LLAGNRKRTCAGGKKKETRDCSADSSCWQLYSHLRGEKGGRESSSEKEARDSSMRKSTWASTSEKVPTYSDNQVESNLEFSSGLENDFNISKGSRRLGGRGGSTTGPATPGRGLNLHGKNKAINIQYSFSVPFLDSLRALRCRVLWDPGFPPPAFSSSFWKPFPP